MIEREFIRNKVKNLRVKEEVESIVEKSAGIGSIIVEKTPLSETISIDAVRPGLIIGRGGEIIKKITAEIKRKYKLDNPQIKVREITQPNLNASAVARRIASTLERFGSRRFKSVGHRTVADIIRAGALGAEILISGKVPGKRAKVWRFYDGYMKKCGEISDNYIDTAIESATLPSGVVGIQVKIMGADIPLPDRITIIEPAEIVEEKIKVAVKEAEKTETKEEATKKIAKKEKKEEKKKVEKVAKKAVKVVKKVTKKTVKKKAPVKKAKKKVAKKVTKKKETKKK